jgi:hypothetical protein
MTEIDERSVAESYAELARANFEKDGELSPVLIMHGETKSAICSIKMNEDMPMAYGRVLALGAGIVKPSYIVTITEVWAKMYRRVDDPKEAKRIADSVQRGDLGRAAEAGDPEVRTALMTIAWSMDPRRAVSVIDTVLDDKTYDRMVTVGENDGHMADCVIEGWKFGLRMEPPPEEVPDELLAVTLGLGGDVVSVIFASV